MRKLVSRGIATTAAAWLAAGVSWAQVATGAVAPVWAGTSVANAAVVSTNRASFPTASAITVPSTANVPTPTAAPTNTVAAATNDAMALKFMQTCAGCHTFGGGKLTGPDLIVASTWPKADLQLNIKRMEEKVGPLGSEVIEQLADLLKDTGIRDRLKAAAAEIARQFAAKMEPGSAVVGRGLFTGKVPLVNGGPACAACHSVDGQSRLLGPDLRPVHQKMGETPLIGAIEKASFKIMEPAFRNRPVTRQEALHLAKYLDVVANEPARSEMVPIGWYGAGGAAAFFAGMLAVQRRRGLGPKTALRRRRK